MTTTYSCDSLNRLTEVRAARDGAALASYAYTLGADGNRLSVAEHDGRTVSFAYDALYRLTRERVEDDAHASGAVNYTYDAVGNRLSRESTLAGIDTHFSTYDANDRLKSDTYDRNGNTISAGGATYTYDLENRITGGRRRGGALRL